MCEEGALRGLVVATRTENDVHAAATGRRRHRKPVNGWNGRCNAQFKRIGATERAKINAALPRTNGRAACLQPIHIVYKTAIRVFKHRGHIYKGEARRWRTGAAGKIVAHIAIRKSGIDAFIVNVISYHAIIQANGIICITGPYYIVGNHTIAAAIVIYKTPNNIVGANNIIAVVYKTNNSNNTSANNNIVSIIDRNMRPSAALAIIQGAKSSTIGKRNICYAITNVDGIVEPHTKNTAIGTCVRNVYIAQKALLGVGLYAGVVCPKLAGADDYQTLAHIQVAVAVVRWFKVDGVACGSAIMSGLHVGKIGCYACVVVYPPNFSEALLRHQYDGDAGKCCFCVHDAFVLEVKK
jgi:hypothetical protein